MTVLAHRRTLRFVVKTFTHDKVIDMLKKRQGKRSLREFARELNVSAAYLSDIYKGRRNPGPAILEHFGLSKRVTISTAYAEESNVS